MGFRGDERGQSVQVGAVILFGFLIVGLSVYQVTVVPQQNSQVEFDQSQAVREDMSELRNQLQRTGVTGESRPVEVQLGARFPPRTLFVNPPSTSGTIRTQNVSKANVTLVSGTVRGPVTDDAERYWTNTSREPFTAKLLVYEGNYRVYDGAPENVSVQLGHVVASYPGDRTVNVTDRPGLVSGDRVTLVVVQGNLSEGGVDAVTVDPESVSQITRRETLDGTVAVTVPTTLAPGKVETLLSNADTEFTVDDVQAVPGRAAVRVELTGQIRLGIAAVGVGSGGPTREPGYIDVESRENTSVGSEGEVVVEVRDQFGNPLGGREVNLSIDNRSGSASLAETTVTTDPDGRAVVTYTGEAPGQVRLNASFTGDPAAGGFDPLAADNTSVPLRVTLPGGGAGNGGNSINPLDVVLTDATYQNDQVQITLRNDDTAPVELSQARLSFYFKGQNSQGADQANFTADNDSALLVVGGEFEDLSNVFIGAQSTATFCYNLQDGNGNSQNFQNGDFFVSEIRFTDKGLAQYFVNPTQGTVSCPGGGGNSLPGNDVAYDDQDGDGQYDTNEPSFSEQEVRNNGGGIDSATDLVIVRSINTNKIGLTNVKSVRVQADISSKNALTIEPDEDLVVEPGVLLESRDKQLNLDAGGLLDVRESTLKSNGDFNTFAGNAIRAEDATITSGGSVLPVATNEAILNGATIRSGKETVVDVGDFVEMVGTTVNVSNTGGQKIQIKLDGNLNLTDATLIGDSSSDFDAEFATGARDLVVENAVFKNKTGSGKRLFYNRNNITVVGEPATGNVST